MPPQPLPQPQAQPQGGVNGLRGLLGSLMQPPQMDESVRNAMMAAGNAMSRNGMGFGKELQSLQQQSAAKQQQQAQLAQKKQVASQTAAWLKSQGAPQQLVTMAEAGAGMEAARLWDGIKKGKTKMPNSWIEFNLAQENPEFAKHLQSTKGGNTFNVGGDPKLGKLGNDFTYLLDENGEVKRDENGAPMATVIVGSPTWLEQQTANEKRNLQQGGKEATGDIVVTEVDRVLEKIEAGDDGWFGKFGLNTTAGIGGYLLQDLPETAANDVKQLISTLKANSAFDRLQQMRAESPTGGALGAVSAPELKLLEDAKGSLAQSQSPQQLIYNIKRLKNIYLDTVHGKGNGPAREVLDETGGGTGNKTKTNVPFQIID